MKLSQKAKYFTYGVVAVGIAVPLALKAGDTIPLAFNKGDVISASVMNALLGRINDLAKGFNNPSDLIGI